MKKSLFFVLAFCLAATTAFAGTEGRLGIGASFDRDVNVFYGLENGSVISGGIMFSSEDAGEETLTDFGVGADFEYPLVMGDNAAFMLDVGVDFMSMDFGEESGSSFIPHAGFTARVWMGSNFSVAASHGLAIEITSPPGDGDSTTDIYTWSGNITDIQFTFWFDKK